MRPPEHPPATEPGQALFDLATDLAFGISATTERALAGVSWDAAAAAGVTAGWLSSYLRRSRELHNEWAFQQKSFRWPRREALICSDAINLVTLIGVHVDWFDAFLGYGIDPTDVYFLISPTPGLVPRPAVRSYDGWSFGESDEFLGRVLEVLVATATSGCPPWGTHIGALRGGVEAAVRAGLPCRFLPQWERALEIGRWGPHVQDPLWTEHDTESLTAWVRLAGPDGWVWVAAGYTHDQARTLLALPETHPDRPGPDQLAVMAALRER